MWGGKKAPLSRKQMRALAYSGKEIGIKAIVDYKTYVKSYERKGIHVSGYIKTVWIDESTGKYAKYEDIIEMYPERREELESKRKKKITQKD